MDTMNVKVDDFTFDHGQHDADGDVLQNSTATIGQGSESLYTDACVSYTLDGRTRRRSDDAD
jgi:hypothetical protein